MPITTMISWLTLANIYLTFTMCQTQYALHNFAISYSNVIMNQIVSLWSSYAEALTPLKVTEFGDVAFTEVIKVKWGHAGSALAWWG